MAKELQNCTAFADEYKQGADDNQEWNNEFAAKHNMMTGQEWEQKALNNGWKRPDETA